MNLLINKISDNRKIIKFSNIAFLSGIFFLPSSLLIGGILLLIAAIMGSFLNEKSFFKDPWNYSFITFGAIILVCTFIQNIVITDIDKDIWDPRLSIIGLGNWIPFIWFFWSLQSFLNSKSKRKLFGLVLVAGSFPVLISGFGQYFFNWHGPFETLQGLIVWYQRPIENPGGLSGLFNHQNYAGSWLNFVWPFCIALFVEKKGFNIERLITFGFLFSIGFATFLTYSRNAWIGLLTSLIIISVNKIKKIIFTLITISIIFFYLLFSPLFVGDMQTNIRNFLPEKIILEFSEKGYKGLDATRSEIFLSGINLIKKNPIFGIGAGSFPVIYQQETGFKKGHSHNLLIELALSYGLLSAIIFFITISFIVILSGINIFLSRKYDSSIFDKALWAALFFFLVSQLVDIQYLDGKISILAWILTAGLKNIICESNKKNIAI